MNDFYSDKKLNRIFGRRKTGGTALFEPQELGWNCPIKLKHTITWSEFKEHIWCYDCQKDYFSLLCPKAMNPFTASTILREETERMLPLMKNWSLEKYKKLKYSKTNKDLNK